MINGVRVKVGDIDTNTLDINLLDGTVTINGLARDGLRRSRTAAQRDPRARP